MIGPLSTPLDLWLIWSLEGKGKGFGMAPERSGAWRRAVLSLTCLPLAEESLATYVMRGRARGFIQTRRDYGREGVEVIYLAPAPNCDGFSTAILEALVNYASWRLGSLGVKRLFIDVPEGEEAFFRQSGFSVYAREFLHPVLSLPGGLPEPGDWQPCGAEERLNVEKICQSVTPTAVRQMEGSFPGKKPSFLHRLMVERKERALKRGAEAVAFLLTWKEGGSRWMKLFIDPAHRKHSPTIVGMALAWASANFPPPFTFRVRSYDEALARGLEEWGLTPQRSLSIMARDTLAVGKVLLRQIPAIS